MLTILQLSDIHFAHREGSTFDLDREIQDGLLGFLPDLHQRVGEIGLIVVSGDIAFSGVADQYARAKGFLRDVRSRLGNPEIPVRVIPGNHDIHLEATDNADQRSWRSALRKTSISTDDRDDQLVTLLQDEQAGPGLVAPLQAYNDFAAAFDCAISPNAPYWEHSLFLEDGWRVRVRGLTSVLLSNEHDGKDGLVLGSVQLLGLQRRPGEINVTLCHHPYCWLLDADRVRSKLYNRSHIHVTGHVHAHGFVGDSKHVHLRAGAMQPPRKEKTAPRFNTLTLRVTADPEPQLEVTLVALVWDSDRDSFVVDARNCATRSLTLTVPPPDGPALELAADTAKSRLTEQLAALPFADQMHSARAIGLVAPEGFSQATNHRIGAIIDYATRSGQLDALWNQVNLRHGRQQSDEVNPFRRAYA